MWVSAFGRFQKHELAAGETMVVDNGIMLASTLDWELASVAGGMFRSWFSGEGFAMQYKGPGPVYTQNRNFNQFLMLVAPREPVAVAAAGGIFDLFGNSSGGGLGRRIAGPQKGAAKTKTPQKASPKSASPKSAAQKKAAPKSAAPKSAAQKKAAPKSAAQKSAAQKKAAPKSAAPKSAAPKSAARKKAIP
jgi:hypothetical protein